MPIEQTMLMKREDIKNRFVSMKEACIWASEFLGRSVTIHNIQYLTQYAKITKHFGSLIDLGELKNYYEDNIIRKQDNWKSSLGNDVDWGLSFSHLRESDTTKHVHRLHPYKGKFIPQLVEYFLDEHINTHKKEIFFKSGDTVLDPFAGSGTTLIQSCELGLNSIGIDISDDAVQLANKRVSYPIRTDSNLLKNGKGSYLNQDPEILEILKVIDATPVQRNKGIDGFLKIGNSAKPIPVKIQRFNETLEKAKRSLLQASNKNGFKIRILIKTNNLCETALFDFGQASIPKDLLIVDSINEFIRNKEKIVSTF